MKSYGPHAKVCLALPPSTNFQDRSPSPDYGLEERIVRLLSEARAQTSPDRVSATPASPSLAPSLTAPVGDSPLLLRARSSDELLPSLPVLVSPNPSPVSSCSTKPTSSLARPPGSPVRLPDSSLWEWKGATNVLSADATVPVIGGSWIRGGGGRRFRSGPASRVAAAPIPLNDELILARRVMLSAAQTAPPPISLLPNIILPPSPPLSFPSSTDAVPPVADCPAAQPVVVDWMRPIPARRPPPAQATTAAAQTSQPPARPGVGRGRGRAAPSTGGSGGAGGSNTRTTGNRRAARVPTPAPVVGDCDGPSDTELPPEPRSARQPKLTQQQTEWLQTLNEFEEDDLDRLSGLVGLIATTAAIRQDAPASRPAARPAHAERPRGQPRRPAPARPRYDPADASAIQKLYRTDRKKAMYHITSGPTPHCEAGKEAIHKHLLDMFAGIDHTWTDPPAVVPEINSPSTPEEEAFLTKPITPAQVAARLARMKNTAPGPDGARYSGLKRVDPGGHVMAVVFSRCLKMGRVPSAWKESTTVLVHKSGDRRKLDNWRPLSLGNTISKLYSGIVADRIFSWADDGKRISAEQKGFTSHEGCLEHNFVLQSAIEDARRRGEELCVAWLDLANAFGSVPHSHILGTLKLLGLPSHLQNVISDLYTDSTTRGMTPDGLTDTIPILSGVKQGCPLSPIIFNLAMEPLIRAVLAKKNMAGYRLFEHAPLGKLAS